jgi:hypothetical protein
MWISGTTRAEHFGQFFASGPSRLAPQSGQDVLRSLISRPSFDQASRLDFREYNRFEPIVKDALPTRAGQACAFNESKRPKMRLKWQKTRT